MSNPGIILLAAGGSSRMGRSKQLLQVEGLSLLERATRTALETKLNPVTVVLGAGAAACGRLLQTYSIALAYNNDWASGMGSSMRCGLKKLLAIAPDCPAALFMLVDQPLITARNLIEIVTCWQVEKWPIIASSFADAFGPPVLFERSFFPLLEEIPNNTGAKSLVQNHENNVRYLPLEVAAEDLDTPGDYQKSIQRFNRR